MSDRASKLVQDALPDVGITNIPALKFIKRAVLISILSVTGLFVAAFIVAALVPVAVTVRGSGTLEPAEVFSVRAPEAGRILGISVHAGDTVRAGATLVRMDPGDVRVLLADSRWRQREAVLAARRARDAAPINQLKATAQLNESRNHFTRARATLVQRMADFGFFGDPDSAARTPRPVHAALDAAVAEYNAAAADIEIAKTQVSAVALSGLEIASADAEVSRLGEQIRATTARESQRILIAPKDGYVLTDGLDRMIGTAVSAGESILELSGLSGWSVLLGVSEADARRVAVGGRAEVEVGGVPGVATGRLAGRVVQVSPEAAAPPSTGAPSLRLVSIRVLLDSSANRSASDLAVRRGAAVTARIVVRSAPLLSLLRDAWVANMR